jgi:hypothetical protein
MAVYIHTLLGDVANVFKGKIFYNKRISGRVSARQKEMKIQIRLLESPTVSDSSVVKIAENSFSGSKLYLKLTPNLDRFLTGLKGTVSRKSWRDECMGHLSRP